LCVSSSSWRKERNNKLTMQTRSSGSAHLISCVVASKTEDYIRLLMKSDILWKKKKLWKNLEKKSDSYRWNKRRRIEWERKGIIWQGSMKQLSTPALCICGADIVMATGWPWFLFFFFLFLIGDSKISLNFLFFLYVLGF
jgi:hypothetical protein